MKIAFGDIGREKSRYTIQESSWLPSGEVEVISPLNAIITLQATDKETVYLEGNLSGKIRLDCARCSDQVSHELHEEFYYLVTLREEEISELQEQECSEEECDTLYLKEPLIDVAEILREQLYLAIPGKVVCSDDCRGLCPDCGGSFNRNECSCAESPAESPFAILKKLKKD